MPYANDIGLNMRIRGILPACLVVGGITLSVGCLIIPARNQNDPPWHDQHKPIDDHVVAALKPGLTTRDEVLRDIGTPSNRLLQDQLLVYSWSNGSGGGVHLRVWICGKDKWSDEELLANKDPGTMQHLLLRFDGNGVLQEKKRHSGGYINSDASCMADAVKFARD